MLRVALVDDHTVLREGLAAALSALPDIEVVGGAGDAKEAYQLVEEKSPDVVVLDISLPGPGGFTIARELLRRNPEQRVLFLTMHTTEDIVAEGLGTGALGYAGKDQPVAEVISAIRAVGNGQPYLAPRISRFVLDGYTRARHGRPVGPLDALSPREREVFDLLVQGISNKGISAQLNISLRTVETHRAHILRKLQLHSISELFQFAARHGCLNTMQAQSA